MSKRFTKLPDARASSEGSAPRLHLPEGSTDAETVEAYRHTTSKFTTLLVATGCAFLAFDMLGTDFGLPAFVTTKRLGLFILTAAVVFRLKPSAFPRSSVLSRVALVVIIVAFWTFLSCLYNDVPPAKTAISFLRWALIAYAVCILNLLLPGILITQQQRFVEYLCLLASIIVFATVVWALMTNGTTVFSSWFALQSLFESLSCGNSRFMNGLFMCSIFPIGAAFGFLKVRPKYWVLSLGAVGVFTVLVLFDGSRQTLGALVLYALFCISMPTWMHSRVRTDANAALPRRTRLHLVAGALAISILVCLLLASPGNRETLNRTFVERTQRQHETGSQGRLQVVRDAFRTASAHPVFGVGEFVPGHPKWNTLGMDTHNGYANLMANSGFPPLVLLLITCLACVVWALRRHTRSGQNFGLGVVTCSAVVVYLGWSVQFNDILQDYFLFFLVSLMVHSVNSHNGSHALLASSSFTSSAEAAHTP